jgi:hypothetical protein
MADKNLSKQPELANELQMSTISKFKYNGHYAMSRKFKYPYIEKAYRKPCTSKPGISENITDFPAFLLFLIIFPCRSALILKSCFEHVSSFYGV